MDKCFWIIVLVLDGYYLKNGKFVAMVNGGTAEFPDTIQRIYHTDIGFKVLAEHAVLAADAFTGQAVD